MNTHANQTNVENENWALSDLNIVKNYLIELSISWCTTDDEKLSVLDKIERIHAVSQLIGNKSKEIL